VEVAVDAQVVDRVDEFAEDLVELGGADLAHHHVPAQATRGHVDRLSFTALASRTIREMPARSICGVKYIEIGGAPALTMMKNLIPLPWLARLRELSESDGPS